MKKIILLPCILCLIISGCGKQGEKPEKDAALAKKYARYRIAVYKDREMKKWLATLSMAEPVDLLQEEKVPAAKGSQKELSRIRLSDDTAGYIESKHLADLPVVFTDDTRAHVRNNIGSAVKATIPAGTIGFITAEKGHWVQIYAGKIDGKWITKEWVKDGYTTDQAVVLEAKQYGKALELIKKGGKDPASKEMEEAMELLREVSSSMSVVGKLAGRKIEELKNDPGEPFQEEKKDVEPDKVPDSNIKEDNGGTVN